jgi:hypothetical protein
MISQEELIAQRPIGTEWWRATEYERARTYWPRWQLCLWPGDHDWVWREAPSVRFVLGVLLDPDEPLSARVLVAVLAGLADPAATRLSSHISRHRRSR